MHICFVHKDIANISRGGVSTLLKTIAEGISKQNDVNISVITQQDYSHPNINVIRLPIVKDKLKYSRLVTEELLKLRPDIAECSSWGYELLDILRSNQSEIKLTARIEPSALTLFNAQEHAAYEKEMLNGIKNLVAVSEYAKQDNIKIYGIKQEIKVIRNGIDVDKIQNININSKITTGEILTNNTWKNIDKKSLKKIILDDHINVFWVGKPTKMKGYDFLGKIVQDSPWKFNYIINIGYAEEYVKWRKELKDKCTFIRDLSREDQISLWKSADVYLNTSRWEGFGLVMLESAAAQTPIIANKHCEVYKEYFHGSWGILMNISNTRQVIKTMKSIFTDAASYTFENLDHYKSSKLVEESLDYYKNINEKA